MAKDKVALGGELDESVVQKQQEAQKAPKQSAQSKQPKKKSPGETRPNVFKRIAKVFREMISELKKVEWPPFKRTKNNPGVWANLGTVIVVVLFFLVVITAFDSGLLALFRLLMDIPADTALV